MTEENIGVFKIEITPEMISAGAEEFCCYDSRVDMPEDIAERIYLKMEEARRINQKESQLE